MKTILFPGQGTQFKGMGKDLFNTYPQLTKLASEVLGYSIKQLCLDDPESKLNLTQFTQPALFVVNALAYYKLMDEDRANFHVDFAAGHSLGEYNALLAADAFNFETGIALVKKRGELMGAAQGGGMAAVLGVSSNDILLILNESELVNIDLANYNTPTQLVIAGPMVDILRAEKIFLQKGIRFIVLNVAAPFHSRYMKHSQELFENYLNQFTFNEIKLPVIANTTALPYLHEDIAHSLSSQIASSVLWSDSIRYLMGCDNKMTYIEIGGNILSKMVSEIKKESVVLKERETINNNVESDLAFIATHDLLQESAVVPCALDEQGYLLLPDQKIIGNLRVTADLLGSKDFRNRYGIKFAYLSGAMYRGIASAELVVRMGNAGFMGFFGSGGLSLQEIEKAIQVIQGRLSVNQAYGMNLLANYANPDMERATIELYLKYAVRNIEAAAFMQLTSSVVLYRLKGLRKDFSGKVVCENKILAKVSRPEIAEIFLSPPPIYMVQKLLDEGLITIEQAELAKNVPMSHDICVEADSGGHTDGGIPSVLLPTMIRLKKEISKKFNYAAPICLGLGGGIGSPEAVVAAFIMGADFVMTGSINQCTVEAGISDSAKNLLQDINIQDTDYAPAGDMFEMGAKVQVLKKGVFFSARANKLFSLYSNYNSLSEIPEKTQKQLQDVYFKKSFDEIWKDTVSFLEGQNKHQEIAKSEANSKYKMALIFRWYFGNSTKLAFEGKEEDKVNYQLHTGPALGAFNQWVKGTKLEKWSNRHVDEIGQKMMVEAAEFLNHRIGMLVNAE